MVVEVGQSRTCQHIYLFELLSDVLKFERRQIFAKVGRYVASRFVDDCIPLLTIIVLRIGEFGKYKLTLKALGHLNIIIAYYIDVSLLHTFKIRIIMTQLEYRNRSISELITQLNTLGQSDILLEPIRLLAIHEADVEGLSRFKNNNAEQFFTTNSQKKYFYDKVHSSVSSDSLREMMELYQKGFNSTLIMVMPKEQAKVISILRVVQGMIGDSVCLGVQLSQEGITDMIGNSKMTQRQLQSASKYYKISSSSFVNSIQFVLKSKLHTIKLIKIRPLIKSQPSNNVFSLLFLPPDFLTSNNSYLSSTKSQLTQIFNYLKTNTNKRYQHFSKLLTKRLPSTNIIAHLLLQDSASMIVNYIGEGGLAPTQDRLSFFDKFRGVSAFIKKNEQRPGIQIMELPTSIAGVTSKSKSPVRNKAGTNSSKTDRTPIAQLQEDNQLDYCRSFQRKTHKYSVNQQQLFGDSPGQMKPVINGTHSPLTHKMNAMTVPRQFQPGIAFNATIPKSGVVIPQSEAIAILKSQHAIEVSQYHQTIQQLNRKLIVLTNEKGLGELYSIHQKQIMLLELKIKELRVDIASLSSGAQEKTMKGMVRKLNQQVKRLENRNSQLKVSSGKILVLEKQVADMTKKIEESQSIRKKLAFELQYATKRLKICDAEIQSLYNKEVGFKETQLSSPGNVSNKLSLSDIEVLRQIQILAKSTVQGNEQSRQFLMRKITNILTDLSSSRETILECNDFLVQLEEHLEEKLSGKEPQIVLDCNKFIRSFLMDNLNIF